MTLTRILMRLARYMTMVRGDYQATDRETGVPPGQGRFAHIWESGAGDQWVLDHDLGGRPYEPAVQ